MDPTTKKQAASSPAEVSRTTSNDGDEKGTKRSACDSSDEVASSDKRAKTEGGASPLDLAVTLGYMEGDRIEVQWEIENNDTGNVEVHWWGATLLKHDGRMEDSVAIRQLLYDAYKDFAPSKEEVIFLGDDLLSSPDSTNQMKFRREGQDEVVWLNDDDLEEELNTILMGAMTKNQQAWRAMPPAQQAVIAEKIAEKKQKLVAELRSHEGVITSDKIKDVMQKAFT